MDAHPDTIIKRDRADLRIDVHRGVPLEHIEAESGAAALLGDLSEPAEERTRDAAAAVRFCEKA